MANDVTRFPVTGWERACNRRGKRSVSCIVSDRFLVFGRVEKHQLNMGRPVFVDVLTEGTESGQPKKLCSLAVTLEQLQEILALLESEVQSK